MQSQSTRKTVSIIAILLIVLWFLIACTLLDSIPTPIPSSPTLFPIGIGVGYTAPNFTLSTTDNSTIELNSFRGHSLMVNFWASWCGPCRAEMPGIQRVYDAYQSQGFVVLGINYQEAPTTVANFRREYKLAFPVLLDASGAVSRVYGVSGFPTSFFLDTNGIIRYISYGSMTQSQIEDILETYLSLRRVFGHFRGRSQILTYSGDKVM